MANHPVVHLELSAKDTKAARKSYEEFLGWKIETDDELHYV